MKTKTKKKELFLIILLIFTIICSYIPYTAYADITDSSEQNQSVKVEDTTISIDNNEFPKGSELSANSVENDKKIKKIISKERKENENVAFSYTYDIKMLDKNGKEIQPDNKINLIFKNKYFEDKNIKANIYHILETEEGLKAEKLETEQDKDKVVAETDGFSYYTVEFTYDNKQYVLNGGKTIELDTILKEVGLVGEVSNVKVSNEKLFSAKKQDKEWIIESHKAFKTDEWMKVTIDDIEYEIKVTDDITSNTKEITITKKWNDGLTGSEANNRETPKISLSYKPTNEAYAEFDSSTGILRIFRDDEGKYKNGRTSGTKIYYAGIEDITGETNPKWYDKRNSVTKVIIEDIFRPKTAYYMFANMSNLTEIENMENLDTSECTNMRNMFGGCSNLSTLDVSHFDTSNVTTMRQMFFGCEKLTSLDLSHFDTSNVTDMESMFGICYELTATLNIMNMPTSYSSMCIRTSMHSGQLTLKYIAPVTSADIDTLVATAAASIPRGNVVNGGQGTFTQPTPPSKLFESNDNNWTKVDDDTWTYTFKVPNSAENLKVWESKVPNHYDTNADENHKKTITNDTATITNAINAKKITITKKWGDDLTGSDANNREIPKVSLSTGSVSLSTSPESKAYAEFDSSTGILRIFRDEPEKYTNKQTDGTKTYYAGLEDITGETNPKWSNRSGSVTKVIIENPFRPKTAYRMFFDMSNLTKIEGIENLDTSECTNMEDMFSLCNNLTSLDVSQFDTSKVTNMSSMFVSCENLTELDLSNFDTSKVTNMSDMFRNCTGLTSLDVSHFDTSKVTNMSSMFESCEKLENLDVSHFNTSNVTEIDFMFWHCYKLTATLNIMKMPSIFRYMCRYTARDSGKLTLKYISPVTSANIDTLVATKVDGNVINGGQGTFTQPTPLSKLYESNDNNWTKVDDDTWTYTFLIPKNATNIKTWESKVPSGYVTDADKNNKKTIANNTATIYNNTIMIEYNANGGEGYMENQENIVIGQTLKENAYENEGYRFKGWNTKRDGSGKWYPNKAAITESFLGDGDIILYAQWENTNSVIKFNGNGQSKGSMEDQDIKLNEKTKLKPNEYTKEEFVFKEWNTNSQGTGISYKNKSEVTFGSNLLNGTDDIGTLTTTGEWEKGEFKSEGTGNGDRSVVNIYDSPVPTLSKGYKIQSNGDNNYIAQTNVPIEIGKTYTLSCYAKGTGPLVLGYGKNSNNLQNTNVNGSDWKLYQYTFTATEENAKGNISNIYLGSKGTSDYLYITGIKLEEGNSASAYINKEGNLTLYAQYTKGKYSIEGDTEMNGYQFNWMTPTNGKLEISASLANNEFYSIFDVDDKAKYQTTESKNAGYTPSYEVTRGAEYIETKYRDAEKGEELGTEKETLKNDIDYTFTNVKNRGSHYINVTKKVTGDIVTETDKTKTFTFSYYITGVDPYMTYPLIKRVDDEEITTELTPTSTGVISGEISIKDGDSFGINVPSGAKYNITEKTNVTAISNWPYKSSYEVDKDCAGYDYVNSKFAKGITSLPNGGNTIYGLSINQNGEHNAQGLGVETMPEATVDYIFKNAKANNHNLTLKKQVDLDNSTNITSDDTFTVNMIFSNLEPNSTYTASNTAYNIQTDENGKATVSVSIKGRQEVTFYNIPGDVEYTAEEEGSDYTPNVKVIANGSTIYETTSLFGQGVNVNNQEYRITNSDTNQEIGFDTDQTILFTNTKKLTNDIKIKKYVTGRGAKTTDEFAYQIEFTGLTVKDYQVVKETFDDNSELTSTSNSTYRPTSENGTYSFNLRNNQTITIKGIPNTATYKVTENAFAGYVPSYMFTEGVSKEEENSGKAEIGKALSTEKEDLPSDAEIVFTNEKDTQPPEKTVSDFDNKTWDGTGTEKNVTDNTVPNRESEWEYKIKQKVYAGYNDFKFSDYLPNNLILASQIAIKWTKENGSVINETITQGDEENSETDYKSTHFIMNIDKSSVYVESTDSSFIQDGGEFEITIKVKVNPDATNDDFVNSGQVYRLNESLLFKNRATTILDGNEYKTNMTRTRIPLERVLEVSKKVTGNAGDKTKDFNFNLNLSNLKANKRYTYDKPAYVDVSSNYKDDKLSFESKNEKGNTVSEVELKIYSVNRNETTEEENLQLIASRETDDNGKTSIGIEPGNYKYEYTYEDETVSGYFTVIHDESNIYNKIESAEEIEEVFIPRNDYESNKYFVTDENGKAEINFTLKDNETASFNDLPKDVTYQITEEESNHIPSYEVKQGEKDVKKTSDELTETGSLSTGKEVLKDSVEFEFTNTKNKTRGSINVSKQWLEDTAENRPNNIVVNLVKKQEKQVGEAYAEFDNETGLLRFFTDTTGKYENGQTEGTKTYYTGIKNTGTAIDGHPWESIKANVTKIKFDSIIKPDTVIYWFNGMRNLREIQNLDKLDTSDVTNFTGLFNGCESLESVDLSGIDTSNATDLRVMFANCKRLTELDLSRFDTSKVKQCQSMFGNTINLEHIYVSEKWSMNEIINSQNMFYGATHLPNYISSIVDKTYAHYNDNGYLEYKKYKAPGTIATSGTWTKEDNRWTYNFSVEDIEEGFKYYVYEENVKGYDSNATENKKLLINDNNANIINTRISSHSVTVTKNVKGNLGDLYKEFQFTANFTGLANNTNYGDFTSNANGNATYTFKLKSGQSKIFSNIPDSSIVNVTEAASNHIANVKTTNSSDVIVNKANTNKEESLSTGNVDLTDDITVAFVNTRNLESITAASNTIIVVLIILISILLFILVRKKKAYGIKEL